LVGWLVGPHTVCWVWRKIGYLGWTGPCRHLPLGLVAREQAGVDGQRRS